MRITTNVHFHANGVPHRLLEHYHLCAFQFCSTLVLTLQDFCTVSWYEDFIVFLREIRQKYDRHIFGKKSITNYTGVSKQEGMYGAFHEASILSLICPCILPVGMD